MFSAEKKSSESNISVPRTASYPIIGFTRLIILCLSASLIITKGNTENWMDMFSGESEHLKLKLRVLISLNKKKSI